MKIYIATDRGSVHLCNHSMIVKIFYWFLVLSFKTNKGSFYRVIESLKFIYSRYKNKDNKILSLLLNRLIKKFSTSSTMFYVQNVSTITTLISNSKLKRYFPIKMYLQKCINLS